MTAVIYARYSSDNQREESIEGQIRECTHCRGLTGHSGGNPSGVYGRILFGRVVRKGDSWSDGECSKREVHWRYGKHWLQNRRGQVLSS